MLADPCQPTRLTPEVFAECFRHSSRVLWCVAAAVLGERTHAEDVVQEAAMTALTKLHAFEPGSSFPAWMGQIVRFTALNWRRKQQRRARSEQATADAAANVSATVGPAAPNFEARTVAALQTLPETARTCLLLRTVLELDYSEIADVLAIPRGTAMSHVHRARAKMRTLLGTDAAKEGAWA